MAKVFVLAEQKSGKLKKSSLELLKAAEGQEVEAILFGTGAKTAADELAACGAKTVHCVEDKNYDHYHAEAFAQAAQSVVEKFQPEFVLATASSLGKDLLPKLAARNKSTIAADCIELDLKSQKIRRPFFSGKATAAIQFENSPMKFISLRANSLPAAAAGGTKGNVQALASNFDFGSSPIQFMSRAEKKSDRPDLVEAKVIVSGGRSLKSRDNFKIIFDCADAFHAAAGASRAAVDEGLADHDMQVGQTGKTVNPSLYIACGISGAIQHLAGMRTSKVIVAINKDPQAPIFQKATYGIVGDLFEVVPAITEEAKKFLQ